MLNKDRFLRLLLAHRENAIVITTMGVVRPWGRISSSELDFASADSAMGHAADLAVGLCLAQPNRKVFCLNGDGSMLMSLGTLATAVQAGASNLILFVIENGTYEITGNQPIPGAGRIDFTTLARGAGFPHSFSFDDEAKFARFLPEIVCVEGPVLVAVRIEPGEEGPISRGEHEESGYLKCSLADSAHALRARLMRG